MHRNDIRLIREVLVVFVAIASLGVAIDLAQVFLFHRDTPPKRGITYFTPM
jgi:hypothetical protein